MAIIRRAFDLLENQRKKRTTADIAVFFLLIAILVLFVPFIILLIANTNKGFPVPNEFAISTLLIIGSSWMIYKARGYKAADAFQKYWWSLVSILIAGLLFLFFQYLGWSGIFAAIKTQHTNIVRVLVFVHAVHFIAAILLVIIMLIQTYRIKSSSDFYIYFLNFRRNLFFTLAVRYWEFLTFLWVFVYLIILMR